ncbi:MAG: phage tail tape measure protein, partial [Candidatus Thermoplasmatota archaeon]
LVISIDGKDANATINLTDQNIKELYKSFKYGKQEVNGLTTAISQGFNNAREIIQGFSEAYNVISQAFATHLTAYQEQEDALIKLNTALRQSGQFTEENTKSLTDYAAQLQKTTVYGDEVTETVMAQLLAMGLSIEQTKQATLQAANLATVMGTDLNTAARAMADLFNGNVGMIGRYIKGLDETIIKSGDLDKIMAMLNERIGGQAEAMGKSASGQIARMNNAIGDLKENTGELLSNALAPLVKMLADIVSKLNEISPGLSGIIGLTGTLTTAFITLRVTGLIPAITSLELFGTTITGLRLALIKSGIGALIVALGFGLAELAKAYDKWQEAEAKGKESYQNILDQIRNDAIGLKKEQLNKLISEAESGKDRLESEINKLNADIQKAKKEIITKDKEGFEYRNYYETEESK